MIAAIDKDPTLQKRRVFLRQCDFAMDIEAKESRPDRDGVRIAALDEMTFREKRRTHRPLMDF